MSGKSFIQNKWVEGSGKPFVSKNPATNEIIWQGVSLSREQINTAIQAAKNAFSTWGKLSMEARAIFLQRFSDELKQQRSILAKTISEETGKPLWESDSEVGAMINKLPISIEAYRDRCKQLSFQSEKSLSIVRHRPHGVIVVLGPFNFPGHLPNGHIIPALLAGNTIVFKPSELTPLTAEKIFQCWEKAGLPVGVVNLIQGGGETGEILANHPEINGLMFTGSFRTGQKISAAFSEHPEKILALEMGGNNPLVVHDIQNIEAALYHIIQSAYITSGQRCTCARRLILTKSSENKKLLEALIKIIPSIQVGPYTDNPQPFMGPVISKEAADKILASYAALVDLGAKPLVPLQRQDKQLPFLLPSLLDVTNIRNRLDQEIFGPLLQVIWVDNFNDALLEANRTAYGLAAGLLCENQADYQQFLLEVRAGIINWNRPLTGASSKAPFGGVGHSGNHRPSAYYAADYCAYPVASLEENTLQLPEHLSPGIPL